MESSNVSRALEVVLLPDVWELIDGSEAPARDGVISSPFRKDSNPSFSIFGGLARWKDQSTGEAGGVWNFVHLARPDWSKQDIARYLIQKAGLEWNESGSTSKGFKPKSASTLARERTEQNYRERKEFYGKRNAPIATLEKPAAWPQVVRDHFHAGPIEGFRIQRLAERRGWPVGWIEALVDAGLLRFPELPWSPKRFPAFTVGITGYEPAGYHQRIWTQADGPAWLYVPYCPKNPTSGLSLALNGYSGPRVQALPFVLGDPVKAELWIITEGQWDAITLAGALGFFDDCFDLPIAVFGIRGAEAGPAIFLGHYKAQLERNKPFVWLWPDNDKAGGSWDGSNWDDFSKIRPKFFTDHLMDLTGCREIPMAIVPDPHKDFNEYWRKDPPLQTELYSLISSEFPELKEKW